MKFKLSPEQKAQADKALMDRIKKIAGLLSTTQILIWTQKGGDGKTALAAAFALEFDFTVMTNEPNTPLPQILPEGDVDIIGEGEQFTVVPPGYRNIIDCKGALDEAVGPAAKNSDVIIIPVKDHSDAQLYIFLESVALMLEHNKKIVLVANACERGKFARTEKRIRDIHPDLPIVEIRDSKIFRHVSDHGMSISQLIKERPADCSNCGAVLDQFLALAEIVAFEASQPAQQAA